MLLDNILNENNTSTISRYIPYYNSDDSIYHFTSDVKELCNEVDLSILEIECIDRLSESSTDILCEAQDSMMSKFFDKVKKFFKGLLERIKAFFRGMKQLVCKGGPKKTLSGKYKVQWQDLNPDFVDELNKFSVETQETLSKLQQLSAQAREDKADYKKIIQENQDVYNSYYDDLEKKYGTSDNSEIIKKLVYLNADDTVKTVKLTENEANERINKIKPPTKASTMNLEQTIKLNETKFQLDKTGSNEQNKKALMGVIKSAMGIISTLSTISLTSLKQYSDACNKIFAQFRKLGWMIMELQF